MSNLDKDNQEDKIEGLDEVEEISLGDYPIDTVLIRNENRTVHDVVRRMEKGDFVMDPDFQRDFVWDEAKQSKLIESVLMRIPLPVFYLAESEDGKMIVVDGLQRLSTFRNFVNNKLKLKLKSESDLNGKMFKDLTPKLQNRVEDCNLVLYSIDAKVPAQALLDIFERVNSGVALTRQQMRNCLFVGQATRFLRDEADTDLFKSVTGNSLSPKTMRDREFVNRFCAFYLLGFEKYKGDMDEFLAQALAHMNQLDSQRLKRLSLDLRLSLQNNKTLFDKHAFRKHALGRESRSVINASLWDVMSTGLARYPEHLVEAHSEKLKNAFYSLLQVSDFEDSITLGTNQVSRVTTRFRETIKMFKEVLGAYSD